jgi:mRNA interferase RelE/StbE
LASDAAWSVVWNEKVYDDLAELDKMTAGKIIERVETYLAQDPPNLGKALTGHLAGIFRYRYGDYRVLYVMDFEARTITILGVRHRREVYGNHQRASRGPQGEENL